MKKLVMLILLLTLTGLFGCASLFTSGVTLNTIDVAMAVDSFDDIKEIIEGHESDFSKEDWAVFEVGRDEFQIVINDIVSSGSVITLDQIMNGVESLRSIYISMDTIIGDNYDKFESSERFKLQSFADRLARIYDTAIRLKESPDIEREKALAANFLEVISIAAKIAPMVL